MQKLGDLPDGCHLIGDAKETLRALIPMLERKSDRSWRTDIEENVAEWWRILDRQAH
jgi:pyruvate dehydrogenase (quinone)